MYFLSDAEGLFPTDEAHIQLLSSVPVDFYTVGFAPTRGYYLYLSKPKPLPARLYGDTAARSARILETYKQRLRDHDRSTGVLLIGEKGSGKTLLARKIAEDSGLPVISVQNSFRDDAFKALITGVGEAVVLLDEFEKVYDSKEEQSALLTLLDGVYPTRCLFVATLNDEYALVDAVRNRPSRFYYSYTYEGLDRAFIEEYGRDVLTDKTELRLRELINLGTLYPSINFDMLQAVVEEMNRYGEPAQEVVKHLNVRSTFLSVLSLYKITAQRVADGEPLKVRDTSAQLRGHPLRQSSITVHFDLTLEQRSSGLSSYLYIHPMQHLVEADNTQDAFTFACEGVQFVFTREIDPGWGMSAHGMKRQAPPMSADADELSID